MTFHARLALVVVLVLLGLGAVPAHATLIVKSDGDGLLVTDKNGLSDDVRIFAGPHGGQPGYHVRNGNAGDIFKFHAEVGCAVASSLDEVATCSRNGPKINVQLAGGNDFLSMLSDSGSGPLRPATHPWPQVRATTSSRAMRGRTTSSARAATTS